MVREEIERMEHKSGNRWNILHIESASNINKTYHIKYLQNIRAQSSPSLKRKQYTAKQELSSMLTYQVVLRAQT
jgi:hypothetical protein